MVKCEVSEVRLYAQAESDRRNVADDKSTLSSHATQTMLTNHLIPYLHCGMHCGMIVALLRLLHPLSSILESQPDRERIDLEYKHGTNY